MTNTSQVSVALTFVQRVECVVRWEPVAGVSLAEVRKAVAQGRLPFDSLSPDERLTLTDAAGRVLARGVATPMMTGQSWCNASSQPGCEAPSDNMGSSGFSEAPASACKRS